MIKGKQIDFLKSLKGLKKEDSQSPTYAITCIESKDLELRPIWDDDSLSPTECDLLQKRIRRLVLVEDNFLLEPTTEFSFSLKNPRDFLKCRSAITHDRNLEKSREFLVPKKLSEEEYWRNYMFRVEYVKAKFLEDRNTQERNEEKTEPGEEDIEAEADETQNRATEHEIDEGDLYDAAEEFEKLSLQFEDFNATG